MGFALLTFTGCGKEEKSVDPASPESYMNDKAFMKKLAADRLSRQELVQARAKIVAKMKAMVDAKKAELKTSDEALVKAALEKDPEWNSLYRRCEDANVAIAEQRKKTFGTVRGRLMPEAGKQKKISE